MTARKAPMEQRFWAKVSKGCECWEWTGTRNESGYGTITIDGRNVRATHAAVYLATGRWPEKGLFVCHRCDNPSCVRADHLFVGTAADNMRDCVAKGRHRFIPVPFERRARGEAMHGAKLNTAKVLAIRSSEKSNRQLAREYGVSAPTICLVRNGKKWAHVGGVR